MHTQQTGPQSSPENIKREPDSQEEEVVFLVMPTRALYKTDRLRLAQFQRECHKDAEARKDLVFSCSNVMKVDGRGVNGLKRIPIHLRRVGRVVVYREMGYLSEMKAVVEIALEMGVPVEFRKISQTAMRRVNKHRSAKALLGAIQAKQKQVDTLRKKLNGARNEAVLTANNNLLAAMDELGVLLSDLASMNLEDVS